MLLDALQHCVTLFGGVSRFAVTIVGVVGGEDVGGVAVFGFGHAEGDVAFAQRVTGRVHGRGIGGHWTREPGFVAELDGGADGSGQSFLKFGEDGLIGFEIWWELKKDGAEASGSL